MKLSIVLLSFLFLSSNAQEIDLLTLTLNQFAIGTNTLTHIYLLNAMHVLQNSSTTSEQKLFALLLVKKGLKHQIDLFQLLSEHPIN